MDKKNQQLPDAYPLRSAIGRLFDESVWDPFRSVSLLEEKDWFKGFPKIDIQETEKSFKILADVPGMEPKNLKIEVIEDGNCVELSGEQKEERKEGSEKRGYFLKERREGSFKRIINLPAKVKTDGIKARINKGVLNLELPKLEEKKSRTIEIEEE